jgi:hypothetical protein
VQRFQLIVVAALVLAIVAVEAVKRSEPGDARVGSSVSKSSFVWDVSLDPTGRPYDVALVAGETLERRRLAVLHAPSRRVLFMGGEYLAAPSLIDSKQVTLGERRGRRYPVDAIWARNKRKGYKSIVGVVIVERDTPIVRWRELHNAAYGTDGGNGGITTFEWSAKSKEVHNEIDRLYWSELVDKGRLYFVGDADGYEGSDTIAFSNGYGDGGFPSLAGYDASGARAAIVLWSVVVPWRLAFPEGKPPPEVTRAENQFAACLKGLRKVEGSRCRLAR